MSTESGQVQYYYDGYYDYAPTYYYSQPDNYYTGDSVVVDVQQELAREGYYRGSIDGVIGPMTRAAIAAYQSDHGLRVTGRINGSLLEGMGLT